MCPHAISLLHLQPQLYKPADVVIADRQQIEGDEPDLVMVLAGMKPVELREAVAIQPDRLAINHEGLGPQPSSSRADQREAVRPIEAPAREQPDAGAIALDDQAIAVMLDFVNPVRAVRNLSSARRDAGLNTFLSMTAR